MNLSVCECLVGGRGRTRCKWTNLVHGGIRLVRASVDTSSSRVATATWFLTWAGGRTMPVSRNQLIPHQSPLCECQTHIYNISIVLLHNMQHLSPTLVSPRWLSMCWVSSLSCMTWGHNFVSQQPHCQTESEKTELIYNRTQSAQLVCACYLQIKTNTLQTSEGLLICNSPGPM